MLFLESIGMKTGSIIPIILLGTLLSKSRSIPYHGVSNSIAIDSVTGCYWPHFSDIKWFAPSCEQNPQVVKRHLNFLQLGLPVIIGTLPFHLSMALHFNNCSTIARETHRVTLCIQKACEKYQNVGASCFLLRSRSL